MIRILFLFALRDIPTSIFWSTWLYALFGEGLSIHTSALILGTFFLISSIVEIPTGMLADLIGRKHVSLLGFLSLAVGFLANALVSAIAYKFVGFGLIALGLSLLNGASTAWGFGIVERVTGENSPRIRERFLLTAEIVGRFAMIVGASSAIVFLKMSSESLWLYGSAISFIGLLLGASIPETTGRISPVGIVGTRTRVMSRALAAQMKSPIYLLVLLSGVFFGIEAGNRNLIYQPFIVHLNHGSIETLASFQIVLAVSRMCGSLVYRNFLHRYAKGPLFAALAILTFALAEVVGASSSNYINFLIVYGVGVFFLGWYFPLRSAIVAELATPELRATALSVDTMVINLSTAATCFFLSSATLDPSDLATHWYIGAVALMVVGLILLISTCRKAFARSICRF